MSANPGVSRPVFVRWVLAVGLSLLIVTVSVAGWVFWPRAPHSQAPSPAVRPLPDDPRLTYTGPFRNIRPGVGYVGDEACADCHRALAESFRQHRKGQNFQLAAQQVKPPPEDQSHHNPFEAFGARFQVEHDGPRIRHRRTSLAKDEAGRPIYDTAMEVTIAVGSWSNGFSFLSEQNGYVFQTPISWYSEKGIWDVSPGFGPELLPGRPVTGGCLFCHACYQVRPREGYQNRFEVPVFGGPRIGCERCHGPGQVHVAAHPAHVQAKSTGQVDTTIVNPKRLAAEERGAVCEQCHMVGTERVPQRGRQFWDFRPGLPLSSVIEIFVPETQGVSEKLVTHVESLRQSRCFTASGGQLSCFSCHDSHVYREPEARGDFYRTACLTCHKDKPCKEPIVERLRQNPRDRCTDCHMPRYTVAKTAHLASTDHSIPRRPSAPQNVLEEKLQGKRWNAPLVPFYHSGSEDRNPELIRCLAIAQTSQLKKKNVPVQSWGTPLSQRLDKAIVRDPDDLEAWRAKAWVLEEQGRPAEALATLKTLLAKGPPDELALDEAGNLAFQLNQLDTAATYARQAVAMNPGAASYRAQYVAILVHQQAWDEVLKQSGELLQLDPSSVPGRTARVAALLNTGHKDQARAESAALNALRRVPSH